MERRVGDGDAPETDRFGTMDAKLLRELALEETMRVFLDRQGFVPSDDSEEWEEEYRRQFDLAKRRTTAPHPASPQKAGTLAPADDRQAAWPELQGAPAQKRWAADLRARRLQEIRSPELGNWLAGTWTAARDWVDTRDMPAEKFLHRVEAEHADHRRRSEARAAVLAAERQARIAAEAEIRRRIEAAGITAQGLIELVDVSPRAGAAPLKAKLADLHLGDRHLRVFESAGRAVLMVIENTPDGRIEYAIERDEGLVADLKLFAQLDPL